MNKTSHSHAYSSHRARRAVIGVVTAVVVLATSVGLLNTNVVPTAQGATARASTADAAALNGLKCLTFSSAAKKLHAGFSVSNGSGRAYLQTWIMPVDNSAYRSWNLRFNIATNGSVRRDGDHYNIPVRGEGGHIEARVTRPTRQYPYLTEIEFTPVGSWTRKILSPPNNTIVFNGTITATRTYGKKTSTITAGVFRVEIKVDHASGYILDSEFTQVWPGSLRAGMFVPTRTGWSTLKYERRPGFFTQSAVCADH